MLTVDYDPFEGIALDNLGRVVDVRPGHMPSFNLGEESAGERVRLVTPDLRDGDLVFTVVRYDGWTVPVSTDDPPR